MSTLYFAYGSNLKLARMVERVRSARPAGAAWLTGYRITCDKRGADGSGKANLRAHVGGRVWGVVYRLDPDHWPHLDAFEPGYERHEVEVSRDGRLLAAHTYLSRTADEGLPPFAWYKRLVVEGAREHGLPEDWLRILEAWPEQLDPWLGWPRSGSCYRRSGSTQVPRSSPRTSPRVESRRRFSPRE